MTVSYRVGTVTAGNFRLFEHLSLSAAPGLNYVFGPNASGKTTLLEVLYCLGRARSFRGAANDEIAGPGGNHWRVRGEVRAADRPPHAVTVDWNSGRTSARVDDDETGLADLARFFPVQVLDPAAHRLLEEGPAYRRRYLDWGVFHVEHPFYPAWRRYQRALRQRNQALRREAPVPEVRAWHEELAQAGEQMHALRLAHLEQLRDRLTTILKDLLGASAWSLELIRGWPGQQTLAESLDAHLERDRRMRQTLEGPHRAELRLKLAGHAVRNRVSRGQQKLLVAALTLAQARLIAESTGRHPLLLVDDFPAELGHDFQQRLHAALRGSGCQVFLTALEAGRLEPAPGERVFHVEHGQLRPVAE